MPVHDALATVAEAVDDVLAQEGVSLRLLAVLDTHGTGRDDGSGALLAARAALDPRLVVMPSAGSGLTDALVTGLAAARAPLVSHMESDDRCPPERLARLAVALEAGEACGARPLDGVVSQVAAFGQVSGGMQRYLAWQNGLLTEAEMAAERFVEIPALHQTGLYRREALLAVGGYRTRGPWPADIDFWFRWFEAARPLAKLPEPLYRWRQHAGQSTRRGGDHHAEALRAARLDALERLHGRHGQRPRPLRLVSVGDTLGTWHQALEAGDFQLAGCHAWRPGEAPPPRPEGDELLLAVYGMARAREALRRALPRLVEPRQLLFAG